MAESYSALCIVDMQNYFSSSFCKNQISNILFEINKSRVKNEMVYIINYDLTPWTSKKYDAELINPILKSLSAIQHKKIIIKSQDSAFNSCDHHFVNDKIYKLKFCGVNTNACIKETALDFHKHKDYNVNVLARCCFCDDIINHERSIKSMKRYGINIIKGGKYDL
jgi:nicotinamidase-related amidase